MKLKKVRTLVINRKKWWRGHGVTNSALLMANGHMCCLGFYCTKAGIPMDNLHHIVSPQDLNDIAMPELVNRDGYDNKICMALVKANDAIDLKEPTRESRITKCFLKIGTKVKFVG